MDEDEQEMKELMLDAEINHLKISKALGGLDPDRCEDLDRMIKLQRKIRVLKEKKILKGAEE